jgi:hypothetical protein
MRVRRLASCGLRLMRVAIGLVVVGVVGVVVLGVVVVVVLAGVRGRDVAWPLPCVVVAGCCVLVVVVRCAGAAACVLPCVVVVVVRGVGAAACGLACGAVD